MSGIDHNLHLPFQNRDQAGLLLAERLLQLRLPQPITVIALPRGGVPVASVVARVLHAPLDLILVRKIGAPGQPELAMAAVADGDPPQIVTDDEVWRAVGGRGDDFEAKTRDALHEIARRRQVYLQGRAPLDLTGRTVVVVDDGIATGTTMRAALQALRRRSPARLVLAVPVAARESIAMLRPEVDQVVCLAEPRPFEAVGRHYVDFDQVSDDEVLSSLDRSVDNALPP
ncbi:MAG: phosphoribosyltransferase family protein [Burkholderiaceae bacterium]|nr:phosphoribosyltransferase family protein [Burkholderiaceae bacterium]